MPQFNPDKIATLVSELRRAVGRLESLKDIGSEVFLSDPDKLGSAKYNFVIAIEAAIDICNHIISQNGFRVPEDYADTFQVLSEHGAFDKEFSKSLKDMARFRNRLVHLYWEVDDENIYEILRTRLSDFKKYLDNMAVFLQLENL